MVAALLCGCDKQAKINSQKLELLSKNIVQFEQGQARQLASMQEQLTSLAPTLDKMNDSYFEKNHEQAFFFHTNTLYLILMVDKKIESELQLAATDRAAEKAQAYSYYTNQIGALELCTAQIEEALVGQENRIVEKVNTATKQVGAAWNDELQNQLKQFAPDAAATARQKEMAVDLGLVKNELVLIKAQLARMTNLPTAR